MLQAKNKYLYKKRLQVLNYAKKSITKEGFTSQTLINIAKNNHLDLNETQLLFPDGNIDLIKFSLQQLNKDLKDYCKQTDLIRLPTHKRVRKIILTKINLMNKNKNFYRKIFLNLLIPRKRLSTTSQIYDSIDQIWYLAGDTSTDFNFYTKRLILSGIYSRIILFFFNNDDQKTLEHLLDENLRKVKKIPQLKSKINVYKDYFPKIFKIIKN